jgi:eukaryotic-like serine/threonine-protein kinase
LAADYWAQLAMDRNDAAAALDTLQAASTIQLGLTPFINNLSCLNSAYLRGEANLQARWATAAAAEFQKIVDHSGLVWNCWTGSLAKLGIARANALEAKNSSEHDASIFRTRALAAYKDSLAVWKDADGNTPIYQQAHSEYSQLR